MATKKKYNVLASITKWVKKCKLDLEDLLGEITVMEVAQMDEHNIDVSEWFAVADTDGVNAYFSTEKEALAYRLFLINRVLNG